MKMNSHLVDHIILTLKDILFNGTGYQVPKDLIRLSRLFPSSIILVVFAGCAIIPAPEHGLIEGRGKINKSDIAWRSVSMKSSLFNLILCIFLISCASSNTYMKNYKDCSCDQIEKERTKAMDELKSEK